MGAQQQEDVNWLLEAVYFFLTSKRYKNPVLDFIDTECVVFDGEEEMKLEYTSVHERFVKLCFGLIEEFLKEIDATQEDFAKVCEQGIARGGMSEEVISQILVIDDFITFRRMMYARNKELEFQALQEWKRKQHTPFPPVMPPEAPAPTAEQEPKTDKAAQGEQGEVDEAALDEQLLQEALLQSKRSYEADMARQQQLEEEELAKALQLSLQEDAQINLQEADPGQASSFAPSAPAMEDDDEIAAAREAAELAHLDHAIARKRLVTDKLMMAVSEVNEDDNEQVDNSRGDEPTPEARCATPLAEDKPAEEQPLPPVSTSSSLPAIGKSKGLPPIKPGKGPSVLGDIPVDGEATREMLLKEAAQMRKDETDLLQRKRDSMAKEKASKPPMSRKPSKVDIDARKAEIESIRNSLVQRESLRRKSSGSVDSQVTEAAQAAAAAPPPTQQEESKAAPVQALPPGLSREDIEARKRMFERLKSSGNLNV